MNIRTLLPLALLCSALVLSACGNKGPLLPPPPPDDDEWPAGEADYDDVDQDDAGDPDDVDVEDPADDPVPAAGDDGDGDA